MINKFKILLILHILILVPLNLQSKEQFIFETNEIFITEDSNIIEGKNRSNISSSDNTTISSDKFKYNKNLNSLYLKGGVIIHDKKNNIKIKSENITYLKDSEKIISKGETIIFINKDYEFRSTNIIFDRVNKTLNSDEPSKIIDKFSNEYKAEKFKYYITDEFLKGSNVSFYLTTDNKEYSDKYYFEDVFFDLKNQNFQARESKFMFRKNLFDRSENDPRIYAKSISKNNDLVTLNKAIFTSCKISKDCPSWSLRADKIIHNKTKKQLIYEDTILEIYDFPIFYFPKFYHPDPTVKRQSGFLVPKFNQSSAQGTSFQLPYFNVISENKDFTFKPIFFNEKKFILQNEYRQKNKNSFLITDLAYGKGYESSYLNTNDKNLNHIFAKFDYNLDISNFNESKLTANLERVSNDSYLKIFKSNLSGSEIIPDDDNNLQSNVKLELNSDFYTFSSGFEIFENLQKNNNDRYQYVFPYYEFYKFNLKDYKFGYLDLSSSGNNTLSDTNILRTKIINNLNFKSYDYFTNSGIINNFNIYFKNSNFVGKNDTIYKSNPKIKIMSIIEGNASLPLIQKDNIFESNLTPKISLRFNPSEIDDYSSEKKLINYDNIFEIDRLNLNNEFEPGKSITIGLDYKKKQIENINNYFEFKIASVLRDKNQYNIPKSSRIDTSNSNLVGSMNYNFDQFLKINYNYSIKKDLSLVEYNYLNLILNKNNFFTELNFLKEDGAIGSDDILENIVGYSFNKNNELKIKTRRNRKFNLTEFYDLIYRYKNDCLTAGIEYKKTFYSDKDIKPSEDLMFTLTLFPIASIQQSNSK